jgi:hypothetical protein
MPRLAFWPSTVPYKRNMDSASHLILRIETQSPIELADFVGAFVGLGSQFEHFYDGEHPDERGDAKFYVKEVRAGSIIAELVPYVATALPVLAATGTGLKYANDLYKFVETYGSKLSRYFKKGGRDHEATRSDLTDYLKTVAAVAHDPQANMSLTVYEQGDTRVAFQFTTAEARRAESNIIEHRAELERTTDADHKRVLMTFTRTNVGHAKAGQRSGDRVQISTIAKRALPIVYASTLAEERIRHEIAEADENVYKKAFDVDVNVEERDGRAIAYRIVAVHGVIDLD